MANAEEKHGLSKSEPFQQAVIGWILKEENFAFKCKMILSPDLFIKSELAELFAAICAFMDKYRQVPSQETLLAFLQDKQHFNIQKSYLAECIGYTSKYNFKFVQDSISDWLKVNLYKRSITSGIKCLNSDDLDGVVREMKMLFDQASRISFDDPNVFNVNEPLKDFMRLFESFSSDITTGIKEWDDLLGGGLIRGTQTVLMASLNVGKTTCCINFAIHNMLKGHDVLFLTHEDLDLSVMAKFRYRLLGMSKSEVWAKMFPKIDPEFAEKLTKVNQTLKEHLIYVGKTKSFYIEDVIDDIKVKMADNYNTNGRFPALIIDDYPGKLSSRKLKNFNEFRHETKYCYNEFDRLGQEYNAHTILPIQTNRAGYNRNRYREKGDEMLDAGDMSESLGPAMDAGNIITINRSEEDARYNRMYFKNVKVRTGPADSVIQTVTDFKRSMTHEDHPQLYKIVRTKMDPNIANTLQQDLQVSQGSTVNPDIIEQ